MKKPKLYCKMCSFTLRRVAKGQDAKVGDPCPWCRRGKLEEKPEGQR